MKRIKTMVNEDQLLIIDVTKGEWEPLCKFLNVKIPNQPFPHKNKITSFKTLNKLINAQ